MSKVAQLKKKAAEFELKKQFDKALALYVEILDGYEHSPEEVDVALFNRVGDLMLRLGKVADAIDYYERAVDLYADGGFFNNAIALCNKILRQTPGRASIYYKLGKISAQKGFKNDAKRNFLEYADRMQKGGRMDEAFRALKEFADLCPDQDDIRLMLAEQLSRQERTGEAIDQLQTLYERYVESGRDAEARATLDRMRAIDPDATPRGVTGGMRTQRQQDLVFLDLSETTRPTAELGLQTHTPTATPEPIGTIEQSGLLETDLRIDDLASGGFERIEAEAVESGEIDQIEGLEQTGFADVPLSATPAGGALLDLEPTSLGGLPETVEEPPREITPAVLDAVTDAGIALELERIEEHAEPIAEAEQFPESELRHEITPAVLDAVTDAGIALEVERIEEHAEPIEGAEQFPEPELRHEITPAVLDAVTDAGIALGLEQIEERSEQLPEPPLGPPGLEFLEGTDTPSSFPSLDADDTPLEEWRGPRERAEHEVSRSPVDGLPLMELGAAESLAITHEASEVPLLDLDSDDYQIPTTGSVPLVSGPTPEEIRAIANVTPTAVAPHTQAVQASIESLQAAVDQNPADAALRRQLGEAMLEAGHREEGLNELEGAMTAFERAEDLESAASVADEIVRANPGSVRLQQKRVEYAFRTNDKPRLVEAYLDLASALLHGGQADKARAVYQRVLDLSPDEPRAVAALTTFAPPENVAAAGKPPRDGLGASRGTVAPAATNGFVNLGDMLRDEPALKSTRMVVEEHEPTGDEEADFADMLRKFKQGIAENVGDEDHQSHYDLGIAFKEMGLVDEAIAEFQKALRSPSNRVPTYEALGQCFVEKEQYQLASTVLGRALNEAGATDDALIGVLYLLGRASEALGRTADALAYYQRVFVLDIQFRDVARRIADVEQATT